MASISVYNIGTTSFSVKLTGLQTEGVNYTRQCYWVAYDLTNNGNSTAGGYTYITQGSLEGGDYTFTGMSPNHQYQVSCRVTRTDTGAYLTSIQSSNFYTKSGGSGGGSNNTWWLYDQGMTDTGLESFSLSANEFRRYSVKFDKSGILAVGIQNLVRKDMCLYVTTSTLWDETTGVPDDIIADIESTQSLLRLEVDVVSYTTYYIWIREADGTTASGITLSWSLSVSAPTINKWSWSASNGIAYASETAAAYKAITGSGLERNTKNFNRYVWKDMVDKVKEIRNDEWDTTYASFDTTRNRVASNGDFELTATMFNSLRNNLELAGTSTKVGLTQIPSTTNHNNAPNGTIPHPVESGKTVFGHYFITLTDYMNSCIDKL